MTTRGAAESTAVLLRLAGHEVRTAYDGRAALDWPRVAPPDVVLLDIGMPGMDGLEVRTVACAMTCGLSGRCSVAMTGYGGEEDRRRSQECGLQRPPGQAGGHARLEALLDRPAFTGQEPME